MIVEFRCDFCGQKINREDVTALILVDGAFSVDGEKQKLQLELCRKCASMIRRTKDADREIEIKRMEEMKSEKKLYDICRMKDGSYFGKGKILLHDRNESVHFGEQNHARG